MTIDDLAAVAEVDALSFQLEQRSTDHLQASFALNPGGCWVATAGNDRLIGYVFSRHWGDLGWVGVGGVHPEYQGQGIGRMLMVQTIQNLRESGCKTIGLSTQTAADVGIWTSLGFLPGVPSLEMSKQVQPTGKASDFAYFSQIDRALSLPAIRQISHAARPGLDYTSEVQNAFDYGWGDTVLFGWPNPWALAILRTKAFRPSLAHSMRIPVIAGSNISEQRLTQLFTIVEQLAYEKGFTHLTLFVDSNLPEALRNSISYGFRANDLWIPMVLHQVPPKPQALDFSLWAM